LRFEGEKETLTFSCLNAIIFKHYKILQEVVVLASAVCVVCEAQVGMPDNCEEGELLICPDCGTELEVTGLDPVTVEEAPQVQEDWGE
jgi:alpha-aminoadipate carrier protein LysW